MRAMGQPCLPRRQSRRRFPDRPRIGCGSRGSTLRACRPHLAAAISQSLSLSELMSVRCDETAATITRARLDRDVALAEIVNEFLRLPQSGRRNEGHRGHYCILNADRIT